MIKISLKDAEKILKKELNGDLIIQPALTKDFQWGTVFYVQRKEYIESGVNPIIGISPRLVDKFDRSIHVIDYLGILDQQLEEYRKSKGYPLTIKFPITEDLSSLSDLEKVFAFIETKEFIQINQAIEIVKEKQLFDLNGLKNLCNTDDKLNLVETLATCFPKKGDFNLYESKLKKLPDEISIFKKRITGIWIAQSEIEEISESLLLLDKIEYVHIENTPVKKIPYDWSNMKKLKEIVLIKTQIQPDDKSKFILPRGCKIEIKK